RLKHLDISSNRIVEATALADLCPGVEVLRVGPRLIGGISTKIPLQPIVAGAGRLVTDLYLQGFLSPHLPLLARMSNLRRLTIRFMKPMFDNFDLSSCFGAIGELQGLQSLEIYQVCSLTPLLVDFM